MNAIIVVQSLATGFEAVSSSGEKPMSFKDIGFLFLKNK